MNQRQHIEVISKHFEQAHDIYQSCLIASIDCVRILLKQGLAFHSHDELEDSINQGNFLEYLKFLANHMEGLNNIV